MIKRVNLVKVPYLHGVDGEVEVTLIDCSFSTNEDGSTKGYPDEFFGEWLTDEMQNRMGPVAIKKGLFNHKYLCPSCKQELVIEMRRPTQSEYQLQLKKIPPFTVQVSLPSVSCPDCGTASGVGVPQDLQSQLSQALAEALDAGEIRPQLFEIILRL